MPKMLFSLLTATLALGATAVAAQTPAAPAQVFGAQDQKAALAGAKPELEPYAKTVGAGNVNGGHLSFDMMRRQKAETKGLIHDRVTEIYEIREGGGTLLSGGVLLNTSPVPLRPDTMTIGPSRSGQLKGGVTRHVGVGDIVVIPSGTPHEFVALDGHVSYLVIRLDPKH